jgi:hypothetical protein
MESGLVPRKRERSGRRINTVTIDICCDCIKEK